MILILVGCIDPPDDEDEGEATGAAIIEHGDPCPGGGGDPGGGPGPQPDRKRCLPSNPDEICLDCCFYNYNYVDGWKCRQLKGKKAQQCWSRAADELARCQTNDCDRHGPVTTILNP